ncbi:Setd6 [Symbiodinium necroappetens]|uniref:Setd6 protein n=1 Tax=Symbiodinium necroappetens TaxID=1628268 RepID=A0A813C1N1_9DINO|nr:Setd6 [Symbiodinium necroappetens]
MQGNIQWLLNGGFRDSSRPCDDLLVTPADVVSSALAHMHFCKDETDAAEDEEDFLCARLSLLQDCGIGRGSFCISPTDILPDDLATMLLVMCMTDAEFATYRQQRAGGADPVIDLGGTEGEELPETLLAKLYGCLLRLAQLLEQKYDTSLEEDQGMLLSLEEIFSEHQRRYSGHHCKWFFITMLPKLGSRSSFPLFPSIFGPPPPHVLDPLEVGKASGCGGGRFQTEETSVPEGGDISVADINDDDIDFDEEISFLPDSQSQRGRLVQAVDEAISRSRSAVAACASNRRSFEDGRFDFISKGFEELVGYSRAELQSKVALGHSSATLFTRQSEKEGEIGRYHPLPAQLPYVCRSADHPLLQRWAGDAFEYQSVAVAGRGNSRPRQSSEAASSGQPPQPEGDAANAPRPLSELTQFRTRQGNLMLFAPQPMDTWIGKEVLEDQSAGGYRDATTGKPLSRKLTASYMAFCKRHTRRCRMGDVVDKYPRLVDKYQPKVFAEARIYVARFPEEVGDLLKQIKKVRKQIRKMRGRRRQTRQTTPSSSGEAAALETGSDAQEQTVARPRGKSQQK